MLLPLASQKLPSPQLSKKLTRGIGRLYRMFIDAAGVSATFLMTAPIANDLGVQMGDQAWILGTYSYVSSAWLVPHTLTADNLALKSD